MIDSLRALLKAPKRGDEPTAAQLAAALEKGYAEREATKAKLGDLRESMGDLLIDATPEAIRAREAEIADAELTLKRLDAMLAAAEERRDAAAAAEESARLDTSLARAVEIVKGSAKVLKDYDSHAKGAAKALAQLKAMHADWSGLARDLEKAGREADLVAALDGDGAAVHGPGYIDGLGLLQAEGKVELPSLGWKPHWGSHHGAAPAEPEAPVEADPMEMVRRHYPGAGGVWKMGTDGEYRCSLYGLTREQLIQQAAEVEGGQRAALTAAIH